MVLLVERFSKLYSKLENYNHHRHGQQEAVLSASLQAFRSEVSSCITKLLLNSNPEGLEILSLEWIQKCFQVIPIINKAFSKLVVEIDHHMSSWKARTMEDYLKYSLDLLDFLNSFSSSLSCLDRGRISLSYAVNLVESSPPLAMEKLKAIRFKNLKKKEFKYQENKEDEKERSFSDKEWVILQALMELRSVGFWVCSVVSAGLCGDAKIYMEMGKSGGKLSNSALINLDSRICIALMEKGCVLKEVKELTDSATGLAAAIEGGENRADTAEEMQKRLDFFQKLLNNLEKEVNNLFSEVLAGRNELLNGIRYRKKPQ